MTVGNEGAAGADITVADREHHLAELRQGLGERHPSTLAALHALMEARRAAGDVAGALTVGQDCSPSATRPWARVTPDSLAMAVAVANWRYCLGEFATACSPFCCDWVRRLAWRWADRRGGGVNPGEPGGTAGGGFSAASDGELFRAENAAGTGAA
jgi:hypothetical protein